MSTPATYINKREHQICLIAQMVEDCLIKAAALPAPCPSSRHAT